jgi:hypothetical protein
LGAELQHLFDRRRRHDRHARRQALLRAHARGHLPFFHKKPKKEWKSTTFNARAETIQKLPTFRNIWQRHRCLIPAFGYYEWHYDGAPVVTIAGIWGAGAIRRTTAEASLLRDGDHRSRTSSFGEVRDRGQFSCSRTSSTDGLTARFGEESLIPASADMLRKRPVSQRVNSSKAPTDDPGLLTGIEAGA